MSESSDHVLDTILQFYQENGVQFRQIEHEPTFTSEESAQARGEDLKVGGKAILMKTEDKFCLFVLAADRKIDSASIKKELKVKKLRFAKSDELFAMTQLVPGSVPPFGKPILPFELYVDSSILQNEIVAFNAGSLRISHIISVNDYLQVAKPKVFAFSKETS